MATKPTAGPCALLRTWRDAKNAGGRYVTPRVTTVKGYAAMGAFLGYNDVGVWASNRERDAFLDWFAEHRCANGDARWQFCKSEGNRWMGCGVELSELIP